MRHVLLLLLSFLVLSFATAALPAQDEGVRDQIRTLQRDGDDADVKLVHQIADTGTREAAEGLVAAYDRMESVFMRREIVRALAKFAGVADAEQPAMQKLANIAGNTTDPEVRDAAIRGLGQSATVGKQFLRQIVESRVSEETRELAMKAHTKLATPQDADWYRFVWNLKDEQRKDDKGEILPREANVVRLLAFEALAPQLSEDDLVEALRREYYPKIRRAALRAMQDRNLPKTSEMAQWMLERVDFPGADRAYAAKLLVDRDGAKAVPVFLELAKKRDVTPDDLREEMARLIGTLNDEATNKKLVRSVGKGKPHEKVFALHATAHIDDPKLLKDVRKQLADKDPEVRAAAAAALAKRRDKEALPELKKMLANAKSPRDQGIAVDAISTIDGGSPAWITELQQLAASPVPEVRNAAVAWLASRADTKFLPVLATALNHDDWATRTLAIEGLVAMRDKAAIPLLIERLGKEEGRMQRSVADALWQLTAQTFETNTGGWQTWWQAEGEKFQIPSKGDLDKAARERELRRLKQRTRSDANFFGIKVESHRVVFILDVSGSMLEAVYGRTVNGRGAARIDVAKQELQRCIDSLDSNALFNVIAFNDGVAKWQEEKFAGAKTADREAFKQWLERLGAVGGTNLYGSVREAFADKDVDTIFILSDGEPSTGDEIDPSRIRDHVAEWNKHRNVKIHTIAIGGNFEILEWLAADSGGKHVQIR